MIFLYDTPNITGKNYSSFVNAICPSVNAHIRRNGLSELVRRLDMSGLVHNGSKSLTARLLGRMKGRLEEFVAPQASFACVRHRCKLKNNADIHRVNCLAALSKCSKLRHLDLQFVSESITMSDLLRSLSGLSKLETLYLPRSSAYEASRNAVKYDWPSRLRDLHISGGVRDESTLYLSTLPPSVTRLSIGNCPHLSMLSLRPLLQAKGSQLRYLEIVAPIPALELGHKPLNNVMDMVPNLRHLKISLDFLAPIFFTPSASNPDACQSLRRLDLDCFDPGECSFITLEQVWQGFDWAEGKDGKFNKVRKLGISNKLGWADRKSDKATIQEIDELLKAMAREDGVNAEIGEDEAGVLMFGRR